MVSRLDRESLLLYKKRKKINFETTFLLKNRYDTYQNLFHALNLSVDKVYNAKNNF
jgi:hypothetical protein